ncbi:MAG: ATP synthase F1 subunit delta [Deltaproteobacteria bacterium]|nr:ATP synthase F1 subunit delta [Deltaproteobacteria bacterium]
MRTGPLGRRYAKALLALADEAGQTEKVQRDLVDLVATWDGSEELRAVVENPSVSAQVRASLVKAVATRMGLAPSLRNALLLLSDRRRLKHLPEVAEAFAELSESRAGRVRAEVTTAGPMPAAYYTELAKTLERVTGKQVVLVKHEDPSLIAGVVTRVGDRVYDGSVKNQLQKLGAELRD